MDDALARFSAPTRGWFAGAFEGPTAVQAGAWRAVASGDHALIVAPTGSGKTLAAFLWAIDKLAARPGQARRTSVVYLSPLKALGVDIATNLQAPLAGIEQESHRLSLGFTRPTIGVRTGDTPQGERAKLIRRPPDILITTPESLYLMLTSSARATLASVETVIVDEIHAVAGTKRGSHLALSLERLDALVGHDVQRVALSATVRPIEVVASFLGGDRQVTVVAPPADKKWDVTVAMPVRDLADPGPAPGGNSLWPHVEQAVYDTVEAGRSTLVFTNGRRTAERLTGRLNELWAAEHAPAGLPALPARPPAQIMAPADLVRGAPVTIARAHHGSVSKEQRAEIEAALKAGELKCVVATSSLELGIDMGAVDRVIQVSAPPSVASALQRIGRAGHVVGAVSSGDIYPLFRADLAPAIVAAERLLSGDIEALRMPRQPLDVLAQQTVAATAAAGEAGLDIAEWWRTITRAAPYRQLNRDLLNSVIELLTGAFPSADFGSLRARIVLGEDGRLYARPGALRLAATSGGTIPDRGLFGVFLAGDGLTGKRVGELDEEMVYESRVGDVFALGASSWRIEEITRDQVRVSPAPGNTGRLPFWHGEDDGRPAEFGASIGRLHREASREPARLERPYLDDFARTNLQTYLAEQREATGAIPDERTVVVERFRDELGDWRIVVHSPLGKRVLAAWALLIDEAIGRVYGVDAHSVAADDGIVARLPDSDIAEAIGSLLLVDPDDVTQIISDTVGGTALFAGRFRECAARALLLPRPTPGRRAPLWQQRKRASQLLEVARQYPRFPIVVEAVREVTQDVYDVPALIELMRSLRSGSVRLVEVVTQRPSPFAASLLFRYTGTLIYDGDLPLAERRTALLSMDPELLAAALGTLDLREVIDEEVLAGVVAELQHITPGRRVTTADELADLIRILGPIPLTDLDARLSDTAREHSGQLLADLGHRGCVVSIGGRPHLAAAADLGVLREALGVVVPDGHPAAESVGREPLTQLLARYARTNGPFTAAAAAAVFALGRATVAGVLDREVAERRLSVGRFTPGVTDPEYVDPEVLRRLRSRSLARARAEVQPVSQSGYARFLASHHQLDDRPTSSPDEVLVALQRLAGCLLPASAWETHVLPARLLDYQGAHLDALLAEGEVVIRVRGSAGPNDPLIALVPSDDLDFIPQPDPGPGQESAAIATALTTGDGTLASLGSGAPDVEALWHAAEEGAIAPTSFAPIRARIGGAAQGAHRARRSDPRRRARLPRLGRSLASSAIPPTAAGHWYRVPTPPMTAAEAALGLASSWLERYGVITRGGVSVDGTPGGFAAAYRLLSELEAAGKMLRGYIVEGLGGAQFSTADLISEVRRFTDSPDQGTWPSGSADPTPQLLAALDPANPYGSVLPWPDHPSAHPSRAAGALVVLVDGLCVAHLTRGGRLLTLFGDRSAREGRARLVARALQLAVRQGRMSRVRVEEIDGQRVGSSGIEAILRDEGARLVPKGVTFEGGPG